MSDLIVNDTIIIPIEDAVIFPGVTTKVKVDAAVSNTLENHMNSGRTRAIALTLDESGHGAEDRPTGAFYPVGVSGEISGMHKSDDGAVLIFRADSRVKVERIVMDGTVALAPVGEVTPLDSVEDLDEKSHSEMVSFALDAIREMSKNFRGAEALILSI